MRVSVAVVVWVSVSTVPMVVTCVLVWISVLVVVRTARLVAVVVAVDVQEPGIVHVTVCWFGGRHVGWTARRHTDGKTQLGAH